MHYCQCKDDPTQPRQGEMRNVSGKENHIMAAGLVNVMLYGGLLMAGLVALLVMAMGILANK
jgi:tetrahydromethanopterin S-methyltransferase subunit B